jgi:hypothetical protein
VQAAVARAEGGASLPRAVEHPLVFREPGNSRRLASLKTSPAT